jgi:hypothetical protein
LILSSEDAVFRLSPAGGEAQSVCVECTSATLSPDRLRVAFVSEGGLYVVNVDGSGEQQLGAVPAYTYITWSPDGQKLGLVLAESKNGPETGAVADLATNTIRPLTDGVQEEYVTDLSFDGSLAAVFRPKPPSLWVIGTSGGPARVVMTLATDPDLGPCPEIAWSPTAPVLAVANAPCEPS